MGSRGRWGQGECDEEWRVSLLGSVPPRALLLRGHPRGKQTLTQRLPYQKMLAGLQALCDLERVTSSSVKWT